MALRKNFPNERLYGFWNILMCYLIHKASSDSEKDRTLFGTLAYRLISKAAQIVPANPVSLESCTYRSSILIIPTRLNS